MKKVISLFSVIAMLFTFTANVAFADEDNKVYFVESDKTATSLTMKLMVQTNEVLRQIGVTLDISDALAKGATVTSYKAGTGYVFNVNTSRKVMTGSYLDTTGETGTTGTIELGTVVFDMTNVKESFTLSQSRVLSMVNLDRTNVVSKFTNTAYGYVVSPVADTPSVKDAVAGKEINGSKTFSTDAALEFAVGATPTIEISKTDSEDKISETLESNVIGEGKTKIIPIVSYQIGRNGVKANDIFTIKVTNGTDTSSWTYTVPAE